MEEADDATRAAIENELKDVENNYSVHGENMVDINTVGRLHEQIVVHQHLTHIQLNHRLYMCVQYQMGFIEVLSYSRQIMLKNLDLVVMLFFVFS